MTMTGLQTAVHRFPTPAPEADGTLRWDSTTAVSVSIDAGHERGIGWTYTHPAAAEIIDTVLREQLETADVEDPPRCWRAMVAACRNIGATGLVMEAISAVDIALWDLRARAAGVALAELWGVLHRSVPVYGSGGFVNQDRDELARTIDSWARLGCRSMKIKIGEGRGSCGERDLDRVRFLTERAPTGTECMVDANGGYSPGQARRIGRELDRLGVTWFEEPVTSDDVPTLRSLSRSLDCDIAAGEYAWTITDAQRLVDAVDCLQLDVTRCGGYTGWFRAAAVAQSRHLQVSAHCAPALHIPVAAATPNIRHIEYFIDHARLEPELASEVPLVKDGALSPNDGLGHGMRLRS